ncbi:MAG: hypothetical protein KUG68_04720, partial [Flavobacteriaceae bacterium]|nr:hypothetical protein [Flavobacteriaceae bacterium]
MLGSLKKKLADYYTKESDNPLFLGLVCGFYPLVFYFSNNFFGINSFKHVLYFGSLFIAIPILYFLLLSLFF